MRQHRPAVRSPTRLPVPWRRRCRRNLQRRRVRRNRSQRRPRKPPQRRPATRPQETPKPRPRTSPQPKQNPAALPLPRPHLCPAPTQPSPVFRMACPNLRPTAWPRRPRLLLTKRPLQAQLPPKNQQGRPGPPPPRLPPQKWVRRKPREPSPTVQNR